MVPTHDLRLLLHVCKAWNRNCLLCKEHSQVYAHDKSQFHWSMIFLHMMNHKHNVGPYGIYMVHSDMIKLITLLTMATYRTYNNNRTYNIDVVLCLLMELPTIRSRNPDYIFKRYLRKYLRGKFQIVPSLQQLCFEKIMKNVISAYWLLIFQWLRKINAPFCITMVSGDDRPLAPPKIRLMIDTDDE